jgi:hypothetical protein
METYEIWYDEVYTYKAWFTADSKEQAQELLERVESGEIEIDSLDNFVSKDKGHEIQIGQTTLNLIGENN